MRYGRRFGRRLTLLGVVVVTLSLMIPTVGVAQESKAPPLEKASGTVRGFDGRTVTVASIGIKAQVPNIEVGVRGRVRRFNETNELRGVEIEYDGFADDKGDPAVALAEARRLVTQVGVFAIVGDFSPNNPPYLAQQKVPYIGSGLDFTYCSRKPSTDVWGFSPNGCQVPDDPARVSDTARQVYQYTSEKTGKDAPTVAIFSNEQQSGQNSAKFAVASHKGAGFDVVFAKGLLPAGEVSDYSPYVQELLTSDNGSAPDAIVCLLAVPCISMWAQLRATGYDGVYEHFLYSDKLASAMEGSVVLAYEVPFNENTPAQMQALEDVRAIEPGHELDIPTFSGYAAADMFIKALKKIAKKGKDYITPENLQKALSTMTWEVDGLGGPISYPVSTSHARPTCSALLESDGSKFSTVLPYSCSNKSFKVTPKSVKVND